MPEQVIDLPDGKKLVVFETNQHPDFVGTSINVQEVLNADIPTYCAVADDVSPALNKNIISIFNNLPSKRIRIQEVYVYPKSLANHIITLQLGYINTNPTTGGTTINIQRFAADFPANPASPNGVEVRTGATGITPTAGVIFGGSTFSVNTAGTYVIFEKARNGSAIQLRPTLDGLVLRQTAGSGTTGTIAAHIIFTLD
jgi:hypothetical protein